MSTARPDPEAKRPTIREVADRAGVSIGTVSNVLNGGSQVSERRRAAVTEAIEALGYLPNGLAQSLRRRTSRVVGLVSPGTSSAYFAVLLDAFEDIAARQNYEVMQVLSRGEPDLELRRVRALLARQVDGLIMVPTAAPGRAFDLIAEAGVPAVMVDRASDDPRFDYVTMDNKAAMTASVHRLAEAGHRRLLYVVRWPELVTTRERMAAFHAAVADLGIAGSVIRRDPDEAAFRRQIADALSAPEPPTAIVPSNSELALALLRILQALGRRIPEDVSVLAFDEPAWAEIMTPPLAVVRHPVEAIARSAWEILIGRMESGAPASRRVVHPAEVVVRGSIASKG